MAQFDKVPEEIKELKAWVCWKKEVDPSRPNGFKKLPINPSTGFNARSNEPLTWTDFDTAYNKMLAMKYDGIGFMFSGSGYVGIDIDHCMKDGELSDFAQEIISTLHSYTEVSPSGEGIHIICKGTMPTGGNRNDSKGLEMYARGRYFTVTGNVLQGYETICDCQDEIEVVHNKHIKKQASLKSENATLANNQKILVSPKDNKKMVVPNDNQAIIELASRSKQGDKFMQIYNGNWQGVYESHSQADQGFCNMLAFWTRCDDQQMDSIFRESGLMRDKWDEMHGVATYGSMTITKAIEGCTNMYEPEETALKNKEQISRNIDSLNKEHLTTISAEELQNKDIPPIEFIVADLLPQGLSLLASPPKYGKSWWVLDLCLSVSIGQSFLNHNTKKSGCLYLALEDSERRLQDRMNKILHQQKAPSNFDYATTAKDLNNGLMEQLEQYIKDHKDTALIVIDTLQKIRTGGTSNKNAYASDYEDMAKLKTFADKHNLCLLVVHHLRKMKDDTDPFNQISGTNGILGAADTAIVMSKNKRGDEQTTLSAVGRDIESTDIMLEFDKEFYKWRVIGGAEEIAEQRERENYEHNPIVVTVKVLLKISSTGWRGTASEFQAELMKYGGVYKATNKISAEFKNIAPMLFEYDDIIYEQARSATKKDFRLYSRPVLDILNNRTQSS